MSRTIVYYWDLLSTLVGRDVRLRYRRSVLGILWSLINPLLSLLIFVILSKGILKITIPHYPVYVFSGLLSWNWFSTSLIGSTFVLFQNSDLIRKPMFPTESLVLVSVASTMVNYLLALPVLVGLLYVSGIRPGLEILALPLIIVLQFLFTAGLCFFSSLLNVYYRDVEHLVSVLVGIWFYLTPVFYESTSIQHKYALIFTINPMVHVMAAYRAIFLGQGGVGVRSVLGLIALAGMTFTLGLLFFRRAKSNLVDEI